MEFTTIRKGDTYFKAGLFRINLDRDINYPVVNIKHGAISIEIGNHFIELQRDLERTMCPSYKQFYSSDANTDVQLYSIQSEEEFFQLSLINEFGCFEFSDVQYIYKLRDKILDFAKNDEKTIDEHQKRRNRCSTFANRY